MPEELSDRQQDGAEPLLAIADVLGCSEKARKALVQIFTGSEGQDGSRSVSLLQDIKAVFHSRAAEKLTSLELVEGLAAIETSPWAEWNRGKAITPISLARLLKLHDIFPRTIRIGEGTVKGYGREFFIDAWERYTPQNGSSSLVAGSEPSHPSQVNVYAGETHISDSSQDDFVTSLKSEESPMFTQVVTDVTGQKQGQAPQTGEVENNAPINRKKAGIGL